MNNAKAVITDSGRITEETTVMGVPCITLGSPRTTEDSYHYNDCQDRSQGTKTYNG